MPFVVSIIGLTVVLCWLPAASQALAQQNVTPSSGIEELRSGVHEELLRRFTNRQSTTTPAALPSQAETHRQAIASLDALERAGTTRLTLDQVLKHDGIRPLSWFYVIATGCADQLAMSRAKLSTAPLLELLLLDEGGIEIPGAAAQLKLSPFIMPVQDVAYARINTKKTTATNIPLWWLREDSHYLLLRGLMLSQRAQTNAETVTTVDDIRELRSQRRAEADRIHDLLRQLRVQSLTASVAGVDGRDESTAHLANALDQKDISGVWQSDSSYARQYLMRGRELQLKWCGFAWPESEIERRLDRTKGVFVRYELAKLGKDRFSQRIFNETGLAKALELSNCSLGNEGRIACDSIQGKFFARLEGNYLFVDIPMRKSLMRCPKRSESPDETVWITPLRMTKQN
jgi:hypothetical protein